MHEWPARQARGATLFWRQITQPSYAPIKYFFLLWWLLSVHTTEIDWFQLAKCLLVKKIFYNDVHGQPRVHVH